MVWGLQDIISLELVMCTSVMGCERQQASSPAHMSADGPLEGLDDGDMVTSVRSLEREE